MRLRLVVDGLLSESGGNKLDELLGRMLLDYLNPGLLVLLEVDVSNGLLVEYLSVLLCKPVLIVGAPEFVEVPRLNHILKRVSGENEALTNRVALVDPMNGRAQHYLLQRETPLVNEAEDELGRAVVGAEGLVVRGDHDALLVEFAGGSARVVDYLEGQLGHARRPSQLERFSLEQAIRQWFFSDFREAELKVQAFYRGYWLIALLMNPELCLEGT
jgi:hypothetical protein